ncbi:hypothetical protein C8T65DRAFT_746794 [Cerioporus squamosus]|nr:hypothetical protein C8T65DRAFT_746794 [Cerioporus squamosus]
MDALPDTLLRRTRNIELDSLELEPLLQKRKQKLPGPTLNAFPAILQDAAKDRDFTLFSSLIPAMAAGSIHEGGYQGSIEDNVLAACKDASKEDARTRTRWAFPLHGGWLEHWVLGWVDYSAGEYGIVDSIPEINSSDWAIPLLQTGVHYKVRTKTQNSTGEKDMRTEDSSSEAQARGDVDAVNACGLDMIHSGDVAAVDDEVSAHVAPAEHAGTSPSSETNADVDDVPAVQIPADVPGVKIPYISGRVPGIMVIHPQQETRGVQKRRRTKSDEGEDPATSADVKATKKPRKAPRSAEQRREALELDEYTMEVEAHRVLCRGCWGWIALHKSRTYEPVNWEKHRGKCPQITGVLRRRVGTMKSQERGEQPPINTLTSYLALGRPGPSAMATELGRASTLDEEPSSMANTATSVTYQTEVVSASNLILNFFQPLPKGVRQMQPSQQCAPDPPELKPCQHLTGKEYEEYILRTHTRSIGGVSPSLRGRISRQLFPYKKLPPLKEERDDEEKGEANIKGEMPDSDEAWARWSVDYKRRSVRSTRCEGTTSNKDGVCDVCQDLRRKDEGFKRVLRRKNAEACLPEDEQHKVHIQRKNAHPHTLESKLKDPLLFQVYQRLERNDRTAAFLTLYQQAQEGLLKDQKLFEDVCSVLADQVRRANSDNPHLKKGIRYTCDYLNFMTLGGPTARTLRYVLNRSPDCLNNPEIEFENVARVKRAIDIMKYTGPVAVAGDCTKVRQRLTYSNDFGSHVLGSALPLEECAVENTEDIEKVIKKVHEQKDLATQTRAILIKIPLPQAPPMVVALLPTKGNDDAVKIHAQHMRLLKMAKQLNMFIISMASDGASSEVGAQALMDAEQSSLPPLVYEYPLYGIYIRAPVFETTGPLISVQDPNHARKTCRNQPQHGTHVACLGTGYFVNRTLVDLYKTGATGLMLRDVENVNKQDDGAARCMFHATALEAMTYIDDKGDMRVHNEFQGFFVYNFVFGTLFEAWDNRDMSADERVLAALRARMFLDTWSKHIDDLSHRFPDLYKRRYSFISPQSFNIFNRLCDSLVALTLAYARYHSDQPFLPWLLGTEFVEHFFGLARTLLPDFTYAELLKLVKHIMLRQHILLSGKVKAKKERTSRSGYSLDYDSTPLTPEQLLRARVVMPVERLNRLVEIAFTEATQIARQLLGIPVPCPGPNGRLRLTPLRAPKAPRKAKKTTLEEEDSESEPMDDDDVDLEADDEENDPDNESPSVQDEAALGERAGDAAHYTARYAALLDDYEDVLEEVLKDSDSENNLTDVSSASQAGAAASVAPKSMSTSSASPPSPELAGLRSKILDERNRISVRRMVELRRALQGTTSTKSERIVALDPKFAVNRILKPDTKMSVREAAHNVRVLQDLTVGGRVSKTPRELRWQETAKLVAKVVSEQELPNLASKNVTKVIPLRKDSVVIVQNPERMYVGVVCDIIKKTSGRNGSMEELTSCSGLVALAVQVYLPVGMSTTDGNENKNPFDQYLEDDTAAVPAFSCVGPGSITLRTRAVASQLLYHLGPDAFVGQPEAVTLKPFAAARWRALAKRRVQEQLVAAEAAKAAKAKAPAKRSSKKK